MSAAPDDRAQRPELLFRPMLLTDTQGVIAVERAAYDFPWTEGIFRDCIRVGYVCRVVEVEGQVAGYGVMTLGAGEAHILNVCIRTDLRRHGIGRRLLERLLEHARAQGAHDVFLEVRPSNPAAIRVYVAMGFQKIGVRRAYYQAFAGREDALVYRLQLKLTGQGTHEEA
jgi:ribosomal-protein-alanine N-acetyltransferase